MEPNPCVKRLCQPTIYLFHLLWNGYRLLLAPAPLRFFGRLSRLHTLCPCDGGNICLAAQVHSLLEMGDWPCSLDASSLASSLGQEP